MKDPAFLFYSSDFLSGITDLTMEERGQYITLLCLQHQKGNLSEKTIRLSVGSVSVDVLKKFSIDCNGNYFNVRLDEEIKKRLDFTESRRLNGSKGGRPKASAKPYAKPYAKPTHNLPENRNENEIEIKLKESLNEIYLDQEATKWKHIDFQFEVKAFVNKVRGSPESYKNHDNGGIRLALQSQLRNAKHKKKDGTERIIADTIQRNAILDAKYGPKKPGHTAIDGGTL